MRDAHGHWWVEPYYRCMPLPASNCGHFRQAVAPQIAWLRTMQDRERSAAISTYLRNLYGDIDAARINVENFNYFWDTVPGRDTFVATWKCARSHKFVDSCGTQYQAPLYGPFDDAWNGRQLGPGDWHGRAGRPYGAEYLVPSKLLFPGVFVHRNKDGALGGHFHSVGEYDPDGRPPFDGTVYGTGVPSHIWVEVMHISRYDPKGKDPDISTIAQVWFWLAVGSGIWINTGNTLVVPGPGSISCWEARSQGYNTIQVTDSFGGFTYEIKVCSGVGLPDDRVRYLEACPPPHIELLAGRPPPATRFAPGIPDDISKASRAPAPAIRS